ncbi:hypothetical protein FRAHR75_50046 [Frankia sp. Hr75.2]|nr:hypothetical protein FRAHR75_50046 [Frankia sp. Hr75.2]SQD95545.1 hypothetical protein FMEAI12_3220040 [Parafrankia sp. Ea1.12]
MSDCGTRFWSFGLLPPSDGPSASHGNRPRDAPTARNHMPSLACGGPTPGGRCASSTPRTSISTAPFGD